ncbi:MAG: phage tail tape measure protein [Candidatus Desulforudaceae bacterium]
MAAVAELLLKIMGDATGGKQALGETGQAAEQAGQKADKLKTTLQNVAKVGLAALSAGLMTGTKATNELNQLMSRFTAETGVAGEEANKFKRTVQDAYKTNEDSYEALVGTVTELRTQMGLTADQVERDLQHYLDFAKVTGQDNVQAVGALDDVLDSWGKDAEDAAGIMDLLIKSHQDYGGKVRDNVVALSALAPAAKALGMDLEQTNAWLNMFAAAGLDAATGQTALNYAAKQFESPEEFQKAIDQLNRIEDPAERAHAAVEMFGARAGVALANAFGPGKEQIDAFRIAVDDAQGATSEASAAWDDNFNVKFALFRKRIEGTAQELVEGLGPAITMTASVATGTAAVWPGLAGIVSSSFGTMRKAAAGFFTFLMANPVVLIISLIVAALLGLYLAWNNNLFGIQDVTKKVVDWIQDKWESFKTFTSDTWGKIKDFLVQWWPYLLGALAGPVGLLVAFVFRNWDEIKERTSAIWNGIRDFLRSTVDNIRQSTVDRVAQLRNDAVNQFEQLWSYVKRIPSQAYGWGRDIIQQLWSGIQSSFNSLRSWFDSNVMGLLNKLNPFTRHSPSLVDRVWAGVDEIKRAYQSVANVRIEPPRIDPFSGGALAAGGVGGAAGSMGLQVMGPLVAVEKMEVRDDRDIQRVSEGLFELLNEAARSRGSGS